MPQGAETSPSVVAVTGSNGFVGSALCAALSSGRWRVKGLNRDNGCDLVNASEEDWANVLSGSQSCVHLASVLPWGGDNRRESALPGFLAANCAGSARLMRGFARSGGQHFVFVSTIGVNGTTSGPRAFMADDVPRPVGNYATSKAKAEVELAAIAAETGLTLTILRPPIVYGPGVAGSFGKLITGICSGRFLPLAGIENKRDMMGLTNLVDLLMAVLKERPAGTFLVRDREPVSTTALAEMIATAFAKKARLITVPGPLRHVARTLPITKHYAERLFGDVVIDDRPFESACTWRPRNTVSEEIESIAQGALPA